MFVRAFLLGAFVWSSVGMSWLGAASISLEVLRQDGYGSIALKRPRPNVLTVVAEIDGRKEALIVDSGWGNAGISLHADSTLRSSIAGKKQAVFGTSASGRKMSLVGKDVAQMVTIGDVQLTQVPILRGNFHLGGGEAGVIGGDFLHTCSAIIDLQNLRLYLRPPGHGHRTVLEPALRAAGLAVAPLDSVLYHIAVEVQIDSLQGEMYIDTGAESSVLDTSFAEKLKVGLYKSRIGFVDASGHIDRSTLARVKSFKIGGSSVRAPGIRFGNLPFARQNGGKVMGLLGINILGSNGAIIDYGAQKLYFYASG